MKCNPLAAPILLSALVNVVGQPKLAKQPVDQSVSLGATIQLQVVATSTGPPIRYQWRFGVMAITGQTNAILTLTNIQSSSAGDYDAMLTDSSGSVTSRVAHLEVDATFAKITTGDIVTDVASHLSSAWGDYAGDGDIDLAVTGTWIEAGGAGERIRLFRNNGDGSFTRDMSTPISADAKDWRAGSWIDYDNDGWLDLFATHTRHHSFDGGIMFFRNEGQGSFRKMTQRDVGPIVPSTPPIVRTIRRVRLGQTTIGTGFWMCTYPATERSRERIGCSATSEMARLPRWTPARPGSLRTERTITETCGEISIMTGILTCLSCMG
ncbi:MAG: hypothetical protein FJ403_15530 [Verrucomicrobia bacterium]|nr:hypothetical protein [Verrucomicrobiota bacterium]